MAFLEKEETMCKILVKIKAGQGSFFDINCKGAKPVLPHRPYVIQKTAASDMAVANGLLTIIRDNLPDFANDEIWSKFYKSSKTEASAINKLLKYKPSEEPEAGDNNDDENPDGNEGNENPEGNEGNENPDGNEGDENPDGNEGDEGNNKQPE